MKVKGEIEYVSKKSKNDSFHASVVMSEEEQSKSTDDRGNKEKEKEEKHKTSEEDSGGDERLSKEGWKRITEEELMELISSTPKEKITVSTVYTDSGPTSPH